MYLSDKKIPWFHSKLQTSEPRLLLAYAVIFDSVSKAFILTYKKRKVFGLSIFYEILQFIQLCAYGRMLSKMNKSCAHVRCNTVLQTTRHHFNRHPKELSCNALALKQFIY